MIGRHGKLKRLLLLLSMLQGGQRGSARTLAAALNVSVRTVFRDIADLRAADVLLGFDSENHEYYIFDSSSTPFSLTWKEIAALLTVVAIAPISKSVLSDASAAVTKITNLLCESDRGLARRFSATCIRDVVDEPSLQHVSSTLELLQTSAFEQRAMRLRLNSVNSSTLFHPHAIVSSNGKWVTVGRSSFHRRNVVIPIEDIDKIERTDLRFEFALGIDLTSLLRHYRNSRGPDRDRQLGQEVA